MPTDSLAAVFAFSFLASFGAVVSPGPVSATVVSESPRHGWRVGPLISTGHSILELGVVLLIGLGLSVGLASPPIRRAVGLLGGIVLLAMGLSYAWTAIRGRARLPRAVDGQPPHSPARIITLGMVMTAANPFWYAWWMTIAAGYLAQARALGTAAVATFYVGHISADFAWNTLLASATSAGRRWLTDSRYGLLILGVGVFMAYLGISFLLASLTPAA